MVILPHPYRFAVASIRFAVASLRRMPPVLLVRSLVVQPFNDNCELMRAVIFVENNRLSVIVRLDGEAIWVIQRLPPPDLEVCGAVWPLHLVADESVRALVFEKEVKLPGKGRREVHFAGIFAGGKGGR